MVRRRAFLVLLCLMAVVAAGWALPAAAQTGPTTAPVPGNIPQVLRQATPVAAPSAAPATGEQTLIVTLTLKRDDPSGFAAFEASVEDPKSPNYQHFLSQAQLTDRFGPSAQTYGDVVSFLKQAGLVVDETSSNRLTVTVSGTRSQMEKAFGVSIGDFQYNGQTYFSNTNEPSMPATLASHVLAFEGLSNFAQPQRASSAHVDTAPNPRTGASMAVAYNAAGLGADITGFGQKIGLVEFSNYNREDVVSTLANNSLPASLINNLLPDVMVTPLTADVSGAGEVILDIAAILPFAPGAQVETYVSSNRYGNFTSMFNTMLNHNVTIISNSWGGCETSYSLAAAQAVDTIVQSAAASGVTIFMASGDSGNHCFSSSPTPSIQVPADSPHGVTVGGTNLQVGPGNSYQGETYWLTGTGTGGGGNGSGGWGVSTLFSRPSWQNGFTTASGRSMPDVAAEADPSTGISLCVQSEGGCGLLFGGTSLAAPLWASGLALINEKLGHPTGNVLQALYANGASNAFHSAASMGSDFAHVGLGSPDLTVLATKLGAVSNNGWAVTLNASKLSQASGQNVTLTATANQSVTGSGFQIEIINTGTSAPVGTACTTGTTCTATISDTNRTDTFQAVILPTSGGTTQQAVSPLISVTWNAGWTATLAASTTNPASGATITLTSTLNQPIDSTSLFNVIWQMTSPSFTLVGYCVTGTTCSVQTPPGLAGTQRFVVQVQDQAGSDVEAFSNEVSVTWSAAPANGQLRVTTSPAVPSFITVDGNSTDYWGLNWLSLPAGQHTVHFQDVNGLAAPADQTVTVTAGQTTTVQGTFTPLVNLRVQTSPPVPAAINIDGIPRNQWGVWADFPAGPHQVCFGPVVNFQAPACQNITLVAGTPQSITGTYTAQSGNPGASNVGLLRVTTNPALPSFIVVDGTPRDYWGLNWMEIAPGQHTVHFDNVNGFIAPPDQVVTVTAGQTTTVQGNFTPLANLRVQTSPASPATIFLDGIARNQWGLWADYAPGDHQVCFGAVSGFATPACQTVTLTAGQPVSITGTYVAGPAPATPSGSGDAHALPLVNTNAAPGSSR